MFCPEQDFIIELELFWKDENFLNIFKGKDKTLSNALIYFKSPLIFIGESFLNRFSNKLNFFLKIKYKTYML